MQTASWSPSGEAGSRILLPRACTGWVAVAGMCGIVVSSGWGQMPTPPRGAGATGSRTVDEQLLEGLSPAASSGPSDPGKPVQGGKAPGEQPSGQPAASGDAARRGAAGAVLPQLSRTMRAVESRLRGRDVSSETRQMQQQIVAGLDRLLAQQDSPNSQPASQRSSATRAGGQASPEMAQPATAPGDLPGSAPSANEADPLAIRAAQSVWGELPDRVRRRMQSLDNEEFLPPYADVIRRYYESLSEKGKRQP
ncbi:MAG: hypothetical protein AB7F89_13805 [Pirellulaceae bacterium]